MPTISDVSSDNSEGGAPLNAGPTFSQMKMGQAERNRIHRDAVAAGGSKPTDSHAPDRRQPNGSPVIASSFPAAKQQPKAGKGGNGRKLNPASEMFIPSSNTFNDLTKLQKEQAQKAETNEQQYREHKNGLTKSASSGSYAGSSHSTISSEQDQSFAKAPIFAPRVQQQQGSGSENLRIKKSRSYPHNGHRQSAFGGTEQPKHTTDAFSSSGQDSDTSSQAHTQRGSPMSRTTRTASPAANHGSQADQAWDNGNGKSHYNPMSTGEYRPLPPIPDWSPGAAQCRDVVVFQAVDDATRVGRSGLLNSIVPSSGLPSEAVLTHPDNCPFTTTAEDSLAAAQVERGVVHIDNIPFGISRAEVIAFVGKNSRLLNDSEEPVHIIMDRVTSKTQDVYVEFASREDAESVVERHEHNTANGRSVRLGDRPVRVSLASPAKLMAALFNVARGLDWYGYIPHIRAPNPSASFNNFSVWVSGEELSMVAKHAEEPRRSPFSKDARERPYECMISTVKKFPWYMTDHITLRQRHNMYDCCFKLLRTLQDAIKREECPVRLTPQLLKRFIDAMMLCPGFTVLQKDNFAQEVCMNGVDLCKFNMPRLAEGWRHQYALGPRAGIPMDVMEYYIAIIRDESTRHMDSQDLGVKLQLTKMHAHTNSYWGYFWQEVGYSTIKDFDELTLQEAAEMEWSAIDRILRRALAHARTQQLPAGNGTQASNQYHNGFPSGASCNHQMLAY
ncbi:hypothetical protein PG994_004821 [Apiospora phragmitis]|uniref:RRM domain-containing protein n=1 Tax=Apiospora phragmitis TaxID=2905665 RepID=A0ABR1VRT3_9PEZI